MLPRSRKVRNGGYLCCAPRDADRRRCLGDRGGRRSTQQQSHRTKICAAMAWLTRLSGPFFPVLAKKSPMLQPGVWRYTITLRLRFQKIPFISVTSLEGHVQSWQPLLMSSLRKIMETWHSKCAFTPHQCGVISMLGVNKANRGQVYLRKRANLASVRATSGVSRRLLDAKSAANLRKCRWN